MKSTDVIIAGLSTGSVYALMAVGMTLVYGVTKAFNFAYGDFFNMGGYFAWILIFGLGFQFGGYLGVLVIAMPLIIMFVIKSYWGVAFLALKDSQDFAMSLGISAFKYKLMVFALTSFLTGIIGAYYGHFYGVMGLFLKRHAGRVASG